MAVQKRPSTKANPPGAGPTKKSQIETHFSTVYAEETGMKSSQDCQCNFKIPVENPGTDFHIPS